jgi:hypothetical protein
MLIHTTHGDLEESTLLKKDGVVDNDNEYTTWVEYWLGEELVHRSVHVTLKKAAVFALPETQGF